MTNQEKKSSPSSRRVITADASLEAAKQSFVREMARVRTEMRNTIRAVVEEISRGPHAQEVLEHAFTLQSNLISFELEALVCAILSLDWDAYGVGGLSAGRIGDALNRSDDAICYLASSHKEQIAHHPLSPYLNLNSYWRTKVEEKLEGRDWREAWEYILSACRGFSPADAVSGPHHAATPDLLGELVSDLVSRMQEAEIIHEAVDAPDPPLDSPACGLFYRLGGVPSLKWNAAYRRKRSGAPSEVARFVATLAAYFDKELNVTPASRHPHSSGRG